MRVNNKPGRPKVTDKSGVVSILVACFHDGMTVREACWQSGISHEAYYSRVRSDEQFADTMAKAQSQVTVNAKRIVAQAIAKGDMAAAKWWLERKARDEFGKPAEYQISPQAPPEEEYSEEELKNGLEMLHEHWKREQDNNQKRLSKQSVI
jgi:hypothetical protein